MALWSSIGQAAGSSAASSAAGSLGSSFGASAKGYASSPFTWFDPLGKGLSSLWSGWQEDEDAYSDERALANALSLAKMQKDLQWDYSTAMSKHLWDNYQSPLAQRTALEEAGFNPLLAVDSLGSSSPSGAYGALSVEPFTGQSSLSKFAHGDSASAYALQKYDKEIKKVEVRNLKAELDIKKATADNIVANTAKTLEETNTQSWGTNLWTSLMKLLEWSGNPRPAKSAKGHTIKDYWDKIVTDSADDSSAKSHSRKSSRDTEHSNMSINDYILSNPYNTRQE